MNKKDLKAKRTNSLVSQLIEELNVELLEDIDIEENVGDELTEKTRAIEKKEAQAEKAGAIEKKEAQAEKAEAIEKKEVLTEAVSLEKIKQRAMAHAANSKKADEKIVDLQQAYSQKAPKQEIGKLNKKSSGTKRRIKSRWWIPLVAILSLIGVVVASVNQNSTLKNFFGDLFPYEDQVQAVGINEVKSGIIYTVEGAFIDNKSGLFIVSMTKQDASAFETGTKVKGMRLEIEKPSSMGWGIQSYLEDNNKKLVSVMKLSCDRPLYKDELTLSAQDLVKEVYNVKEIPVDLNKLYEEGKFTTLKGNEENWYNYAVEDGLNIYPLEDFKQFNIDDIRISNVGLSIITSYPDITGIQDRTIDLALIDTRTGENYESQCYSKWEEETGLNKNSFVFEKIKVQDLPYLKVQLMDYHNKELISQTWQVKFKLSKNSQVVSKRIFCPTKIEEDTVVFTRLDVSTLGVVLKGYTNAKSPEKLDITIVMKDGAERKLIYSGSSSGLGGLTCHYNLGINEESYIPALIDLENVTRVKINDKVIKIK